MKTSFKGTLKQHKVQPTPSSAPVTLKHILRQSADPKKPHVAYYTLKLTYFAFGEVHHGKMWTKDAMPVVVLYWSTPSSKTNDKDAVSDQIFNKEEYDAYIEWYGGKNTPLGRHLIDFKQKHFEEWDNQKVKWCIYHLRKWGIPPAHAQPYIVDLALKKIEKFG